METNKELQKRVEVSVTPPSPQDTSNNLEADDSKTNASLIEGRGWGSRTTRSMAR